MPVVWSTQADLDGDGQPYTVQGWDDAGTTVSRNNAIVWKTNGNIGGTGLAFPAGTGWKRNANDQFFAADVDGDRRQEIVIHCDSSKWTGVFKWTGPASGLDYVWGTPSPIPGPGLANPPGSGWTRSNNDGWNWSDFTHVGHDSIVISNNVDLWIGVLDWNGAGLIYVWGAKGTITGPGGTWQRTPNDDIIGVGLGGVLYLGIQTQDGPQTALLEWNGPGMCLQVAAFNPNGQAW